MRSTFPQRLRACSEVSGPVNQQVRDLLDDQWSLTITPRPYTQPFKSKKTVQCFPVGDVASMPGVRSALAIAKDSRRALAALHEWCLQRLVAAGPEPLPAREALLAQAGADPHALQADASSALSGPQALPSAAAPTRGGAQ